MAVLNHKNVVDGRLLDQSRKFCRGVTLFEDRHGKDSPANLGDLVFDFVTDLTVWI